MTRSIAVFCGARPVKEVYMNDAYEVGKLIAERTHTLVYGGGANGLMGKVYEGASGNMVCNVSNNRSTPPHLSTQS